MVVEPPIVKLSPKIAIAAVTKTADTCPMGRQRPAPGKRTGVGLIQVSEQVTRFGLRRAS